MKRFMTFLTVCAILLSVLSFASFADFETNGWGEQQNDAAWDDDNNGYYSDGSSSDSPLVSGTALAIAIFIIIAGGVVVYIVLKSKKKASASSPAARRPDEKDHSTPLSDLVPAKKYDRLDPDFRESEFEEYVKSLFIRLLECRVKKDVSELRPVLSEDVYAYFNKKIKEMNENKRAYAVEQLKVKKVTPRGYKRGKFHDHMKVIIEASMIEYVKSERSGRTVSGSRTDEVNKKYEWDMSRRLEGVTSESGQPDGGERVWKVYSIKTLSDSSKK